ncbi:MAG: hypothetical protein Q8R25_01305 [bacterium]|nr:hypothetical protein [bacterium]
MRFPSTIRIFGVLKDRYEPEAVHMLADMYWRVLLIVCVTLALSIITYNALEFFDINRAASAQTTVTSATDTLPFGRGELQAVVSGFTERKEMYQSYIASPKNAAAPDPTR